MLKRHSPTLRVTLEDHFMTSPWCVAKGRFGIRLIFHDLGKKGGVFSTTLMSKRLTGTNVIGILKVLPML